MKYTVNKRAIAWETQLEGKTEAFFEELKEWFSVKRFSRFLCEFIQPFSEVIYVRWTDKYDDVFEWEDTPFMSILREDFLKFDSYSEYLEKSENKVSFIFISSPEKINNYFSNFTYNYQIKEDGAYNLAVYVEPNSMYPSKNILENINVKVNDIEDTFKIKRKILKGEPEREDPVEFLSFKLPERGKSVFIGREERCTHFSNDRNSFAAAFYTTKD